jgi:hypothetical protein
MKPERATLLGPIFVTLKTTGIIFLINPVSDSRQLGPVARILNSFS